MNYEKIIYFEFRIIWLKYFESKKIMSIADTELYTPNLIVICSTPGSGNSVSALWISTSVALHPASIKEICVPFWIDNELIFTNP